MILTLDSNLNLTFDFSMIMPSRSHMKELTKLSCEMQALCTRNDMAVDENSV